MTVPSPHPPDLTNGAVDGLSQDLAHLDTTEDKDAAFDAIAATANSDQEAVRKQEEEQKVQRIALSLATHLLFISLFDKWPLKVRFSED